MDQNYLDKILTQKSELELKYTLHHNKAISSGNKLMYD